MNKTPEEMKTLDRMRENYVPDKVKKLNDKDIQWFRDAKFGMFIHWGLYAMLERGEWILFSEKLNVSEYSKLSEDFSAQSFDAAAWAKAAKNAGMKYMVLTARHHDGFCLFNSKASSFNSVNSAAKKDFVREYADACRAEGLKVGLYYSPLDWRFPGYFLPEMYWDSALEMKKQCHEQLRELMTNYGKIDLLWFDGEWLALGGMDWNPQIGWNRNEDWMHSKFFQVNYFWESEKVINMIRELQPGIMINNRFGWEGDFHVRERRIDGIRTDKPWDSNDCIADSWGYIPERPVLSTAQLVKNLVSIVVRDGNYLLNIGPTGNGDMEQSQVKRLEELGKWLEKHGESIYDTRGGPVIPGNWGGCTYRGHTVYVHITDWCDDKIVFPIPSENKLRSFSSLTSEQVDVKESEGNIEIKVAIEFRGQYVTIVRLQFESEIVWEGITTRENDAYGLADGLQ